MSSSTNQADNGDNDDDDDVGERQRKSVVTECNSNAVQARQLFSNRILTEIYHRIKARPLLTGADQTDTVRRISKAIGNLNQVTILPHKSTTNNFDLVDTHRRLVCYCTVIHIIQNQPPEKETRALRHLFVFNDLIILAKDASSSSSPSTSSSKHLGGRKSIFDRSKHRQISTDNVLFSRHKCNDEFLQPPLDLLINSFDDKHQQLNNLQSSAFICAQPPVHCLPYTRRSRSKNDINTHKAASSHFNSHSSTRLTALYAISLVQCKIRPFKTDVYRYGLEFWSFPKDYSPNNDHSTTNSVNNNNSNNSNNNNQQQPEQLIIISALAKTDYHNLLTDLFEVICEANHVDMVLNS
ncbi:unnamed protein product [Trichobilharzia szidati]|nr:unnamed protein product [Trichobilharzia szidati]